MSASKALCHLGIHLWDHYGPLMFPRKRCLRCGIRRDAY